jgi:DNA-binding NarL/FixJ family response regulator
MDDRAAARPVVGRDDELDAFRGAVSRAENNQPGVLLVVGDAGIGKTTLVAEAASVTSASLYLGRCVQVGGESIPFAPLVGLIRHARREAAIADSRALESLTDLAISGSSRVGQLFALALELMGDLGANGPAIVGFEDLHWGDPGTWDLFEYLARNLIDEQVVLVGTYRDNDVARDAEMRRRSVQVSRAPGAVRIALGGLPRNAVARHAASVLGIPPPPALVDELLRRGEGNPLYTEELVAAHLAGEAVPPLLSDLLETDIAELDAAARDVLTALATVGREADPALVAAVVELDERALEAAVRSALDARVLVVDTTTDSYQFRHPLLSEVTYRTALPTERRRLHRAIADALRAHPELALTATDAAGELAFHLDRAGDECGAFEALFAAADSAERLAPSTCLAHLERIFELWDACATAEHEPDLVPRLWQAADLAAATGETARAIALARRALDLGDPPAGRAWAYERLGRFLWSAGSMEESAQTYDRAAALLGDADPRQSGAALTAGGLAQAELMFGRFDRAAQWADRALDAAGDDGSVARSAGQRVLGFLRAYAGDPDRGVALSRAAVDEGLPPPAWALANAMLALILFDTGATDDAVEVASQGIERSRRAGFDTSFATFHSGVAARALVRLGRWDEADEILERVASLESTPIGAIELDAAATLLTARRGHTERAAALAERLRTHPADAFSAGIVDVTLLDALVATHSWESAIALATTALDSAPDSTSPNRYLARLTAGLVTATVEHTLDRRAHQLAVDVDTVLDDLQRRLDVARAAPSSALAVAEADLTFADATLTRLRTPDGAMFARAAAAAERIGDAWLGASARLHQADAAGREGAAAAVEALRSANETATMLGAAPLVVEIEALARRARIGLDAPVVTHVDPSSAAELGLTPREAEVLALVAAGKTNREIGSELFVSEKTASVHVSNILRKLGVTSRVEAAAVAQRIGAT